MMYQMESRCPKYRKAIKERRRLEEEVLAEHPELKETYFKNQTETEYVLLKSVFLLGVKTGIRIAK